MAHLYIHVPFCLSKCSYCSFISYPGKNYLFDRYTRALMEEMKNITSDRGRVPLETVFWGGGSPSLLSIDNIADILSACRQCFDVADHVEISMEINPKSVDFVKLLTLAKLGINRMSVGVQSFSDQELSVLGRIHSAQEAWETVDWAKKIGCKNINVDLIYGVPDQTTDIWRWTLQTAQEMQPEHLSLYQLTIEDGTSMKDRITEGRLMLPSEDEILSLDRLTEELCSSTGYIQYEISNYSKPGFQCRHNINYWKNGEYYAVGAGAVRYLSGKRTRNIEDPDRYCTLVEEKASAIVDSEQLDTEASFRETVVMGLRMLEGVSLDDLFNRFGIDLQKYYGSVLENLLNMSLLELRSSTLRLTVKGRAIANKIMAELV